MTRITSLHIPQPCAESWDAMTPTATGRHCAACQQTVVDFTLKTDAEILAYFAKAAGRRTCGRFAAGQLERPLQRAASAAPTGQWRAWLAAAVAVWGVREVASVAAKAQAPVEMRKPDKTMLSPEQRRAERRPENEPAPLVCKGVVRDSITHEGLPGATVLIKNTTVGVATGADGSFELQVPGEVARAGSIELQAKFIGYVSREQRIALSANAQQVEMLLQTDIKGMLGGEVVVGGLAYQRPWPWHPRRFYYWAKYQLTRPFRRS